MSTGLYRIYTRGEGYVEPIRKWMFIGGFVAFDDARDWVRIKRNDIQWDEDIEFKIMWNGTLVLLL